jgi:NADPH:quinone reductase-like Zn-dependent oxidoreductase
MKAVSFAAYGGPEVLVWGELDDPRPGPGQVLVTVAAASLNPVDLKIRSGALKRFFPLTLPAIPGRDGAGVVAALGPGVSAPLVGTAVCFLTNGCHAERLVLAADKAVPLPPGADLTVAAALPLAGLSAWACLDGLTAGQRVLIHGGAGGVGSLAVQLARQRGARVTATCSAANRDFVLGLGAERVIAYDREDFVTECQGFDVVMDTIGGEVHRRSYEVLRPGGLLVRLNALPVEDLSAARGVVGKLATVSDDPAALAALVGLMAAGSVVPSVQQVLPMSRIAEAHRLAERGHARGKTVLVPDR